MQIAVLGMHRSGTSLLARLLNMMGAYFAPEGVGTGANQENPKGFWERKDIRSLNDFVLNSVNCDWDRVAGFHLDKLSQDTLEVFNAKASRIVLNMDAHRPWMIKEPRLCLLFPLWRELLEMPVCVHVYRHPIEVARSLQKRNNIPLPAGLALWEKYNVDAINSMAGLPSISISHKELMRDPVSAVSGLHENLVELGVQSLHLPSDSEIKAFIDPDLHRERAPDEDLGEYLNSRQGQLWDYMQRDGLQQATGNLATSRVSLYTLESFEQQLANTNRLKRIEQESTEIESSCRKLSKELTEACDSNKQLSKQLTEADNAIKQLDRFIEELIGPVKALLTSNSWKLGSSLISLRYRAMLREVPPQASTQLMRLISRYESTLPRSTQEHRGNAEDTPGDRSKGQ